MFYFITILAKATPLRVMLFVNVKIKSCEVTANQSK